MRIGLFTDTFYPEINGVANSTNILRNELKKHGHEVYVICPKKGTIKNVWDDAHEVFYLAGIELKQLYGYVLTSPIHFQAMKDIRQLNLDIIHAQTEFGVGIFARICAKQLDIPLVSTYHTTYEDYTHYLNFMHSQIFDSYAKKLVANLSRLYGDSSISVIAPSQKTKEMLEGYRVRSDIYVIPTGLPLERFDPQEEDKDKTKRIREEFGVKENEFCIIYVGRIAEEKSLSLVVDGFEEVKKKKLPVKFIIVGKGPDEEKIEAQIKAKDVADYVSFVGPRPSEEIGDYYRASDAFVSASLSETQGMTFIEALASGLPLFARKDDVLKDLLIEGKTGWYFEKPEDFAEKCEIFVHLSDAERKQITSAAIQQVKPYQSEVFYEKVYEVYQNAITLYKERYVIADVKVKGDAIILKLENFKGEKKELMMSLDSYYNEGLRRGESLSTKRIEELRQQEESTKAYERCVRKIASKDRTTKEIYDWLTRNTTCSIEDINAIVERLEEKGYINDKRYCENMVHSMRMSLFGPERILRSLKQKGIPVEMIQECLDQSSNEEENDAYAYARKIQVQMKDESVRSKQNKLFKKLIDRGYSSELASQVIQQLDFSKEEMGELDSLRKCALKAKKRYAKKYEGTKLRNAVYRYCGAKGYQAEDIYGILNEMEWNDE